MARKFILLNLAVAFIAIFCSCSGGNNRTYDARCPELVEKAEYYNSQVSDGPMGMKMSVEYVDSVYRIIQIIDETQIPVEKAKMAYGNMKQNAIASISSKKITVGEACLAFLNTSRTPFSDSPTHLDRSSGPFTEMKLDSLSLATAFASKVLPVPGIP